MFRERITTTLIMAALGLVGFGLFKPSSPDPVDDSQAQQTWFFINKAHVQERFDGVIVGDSRGLRGLSPDRIQEFLPGCRIFNASFNAGGMNPEMYAFAEGLLDAKATDPMIILAPTSLSFMPHKKANSQYHEYRNKPRDQVWLYANFPGFAQWFQPFSPSVYFRKMLHLAPVHLLQQEFHANGWIETEQTPHDDIADLGIHNERLEGQTMDPGLVDDFMAQTARWVARGIKVYSFFPPAYPPRVAMEDSLLEFDRPAFRDRFIASGGIWLEVDQSGYSSYDGSHLTGKSAMDLSAALGQAIAAGR